MTVDDHGAAPIGYTAWRPDESIDDTVARANQALYRAKRQGREQITQA